MQYKHRLNTPNETATPSARKSTTCSTQSTQKPSAQPQEATRSLGHERPSVGRALYRAARGARGWSIRRAGGLQRTQALHAGRQRPRPRPLPGAPAPPPSRRGARPDRPQLPHTFTQLSVPHTLPAASQPCNTPRAPPPAGPASLSPLLSCPIPVKPSSMPDGAPLWPRAQRSRGATCPRAAPHQSAGQSNVADRQAGGCHYESRHWLQGRHGRAASAQALRDCRGHGLAASAPPRAPPLPPPRRRRCSRAGSGAVRTAAAGRVLVVLGRARRCGGRQAVPRAHALQGLGRARGVRAAAPPPLRACGAAAAAG